MDATGGVPEPLLPPQIALQNPELVGGELFHVLPRLAQILVMLDSDGDENYVPHLVPIEGGFPVAARRRRVRRGPVAPPRGRRRRGGRVLRRRVA